MMTFALATLLGLGRGEPWDRFAARLSGAEGIVAEYAMSQNDSPQTGCRYEAHGRVGQVYSGRLGPMNFEMRQGEKALIYLEHGAKRYVEYGRLPARATPPPQSSAPASFAYPTMLSRWPRLPGADEEWNRRGELTIGEDACDHMAQVREGEPTGQEAWIAPDGRLRRWRSTEVTPQGTLRRTFDFTRLDPLEDPKEPDLALPWGYVPIEPSHMNRALRPGDPVPKVSLSPAIDDLVEATSLRPVLVVFTSPDCAVCDRAKDFWPRLEAKARATKTRLVEVVLDRPGARTRGEAHFDEPELVAQAFGVSGTPSFWRTKAGSVVEAAWVGFEAAQEGEALEALFGKGD